MKYISIFIFLLISLTTVSSGYAVPAEAEYGKYQDTWTLQEDGSQEYRCYQELTLFTHTAMNSTYGETFITYNPRYQELVIHSSYTRQKDGTIVRTPENAFVEVLPRAAANAPAYNHLKEMVIVHTGLELGATIVLDYSIITRPGYLPGIDVCQPLQRTSPVKEYTLTFNIPADKPAWYKLQGLTLQPVRSKSGHHQQFQWKLHLPPSSREPEVTLRDKNIPAIIFNTFSSPQEALQILLRQLDQSSAFTSLAGEITKDCRTNSEKIRAIHTYVINQIDNCPLSLSHTGYTFRPVAQVLQSAYGTEAEKANLLQTLLNAAGIKAGLAAAYDLSQPSGHYGLAGIRKFAILTEADGHSYYLSPYSQHPVSPDYAFLLNLSNGAMIEPDSSPAKIRYEADIRWNTGKAEADIRATFSNSYISYSPDFANELLQLNAEKEINRQQESTTISGKSTVNLTPQQDYILLSLPETKQGINRRNYAKYNSKRQTSLFLPAPIDESYTYTLELPENLTLCTPTGEKQIRNSAGSLFISTEQEGQIIKVRHSLTLLEKQIMPSEYADFRTLMTEWGDTHRQLLLLKSK